jgi:metal-responsive CopG/Arc/MetJ family transcriptional regulator
MKPIQLLIGEELLRAADREAKRRRTNRSALVRAALTQYLAAARRQLLDEQYRRGYEKRPGRKDDIEAWEGIQSWPEE